MNRRFLIVLASLLLVAFGVAGYALARPLDAPGESSTTYLPALYRDFRYGPGAVTGTVRNAQYGTVLDNATVCLEGYSKPSVFCDDTDDAGVYLIPASGNYLIPSGIQTFVAFSDGFIAVADRVSIIGEQVSVKNFSLSPELAGENVRKRIVLTWDETTHWPPRYFPNDLDLHAWLQIGSGVNIHVWYNSREGCADPPYIYLENDVTTGSGPESIAICFLEGSGLYHFGVHDVYQGQEGVPPITLSGARIRVYDQDVGLALDLSVPQTGDGDFWYAFTIDNRPITPTVTIQNCITNYSGEEAPSCPPGE